MVEPVEFSNKEQKTICDKISNIAISCDDFEKIKIEDSLEVFEDSFSTQTMKENLSNSMDSEIASTRRNRTLSTVSSINKAGSENHNPVTQLGNDHYMIRRRDTKIFVKGFSKIAQPRGSERKSQENNATQEKKSEKDTRINHALSFLLSSLYALLVVISGLVLKLTQYITPDVTDTTVDCYIATLYSISIFWMISYHPLVTHCYRQKEKITFAKSNHAVNRWLKGTVALFGLTIIINDGLEFIALINMDGRTCPDKELYLVVPVIHAIFIVCQVGYLFRYSKVFTQDHRVATSFGVMHIIATNLVKWIFIITDEAMGALLANNDNHSEGDAPEEHHSIQQSSADFHADLLFPENCTCTTGFCSTVVAADAFLYPFVIEFSLVASCLLYIIWQNIGKIAPICEHIVKPSYKLYSSYKGVIAGALTIFITIVTIVVLGAKSSPTDVAEQTYFTEFRYLALYNAFIITMTTFMMLGCVVGFFLFHKTSHALKTETEEMDSSLLFICLNGPIVIGGFSLLAVVAGHDNKISMWLLTAGAPVSVILQCICQVVFIMYGLKREPIVSKEGQEAADEVQERVGIVNTIRTISETADEENTKLPYSDQYWIRSRSSAVTKIDRDVQATSLRPAAAYVAGLNGFAQYSGAYLNPLHKEKSGNVSNTEKPSKMKENTSTSNSDQDGEDAISTSMSSSETSFVTKKNQQNCEDASESPNTTNEKSGVKKVSTVRFPSQINLDLEDVFIEEGKNTEISTAKTVSRIKAEQIAAQGHLQTNEILSSKSISAQIGLPDDYHHTAVKIVAETRIADPDKTRLLLRSVVLFLLIANACLWVFDSLEGTAFTVIVYQEEYYGDNVWTAISMICRPLSIFFRMHSAACLFEIWSYA